MQTASCRGLFRWYNGVMCKKVLVLGALLVVCAFAEIKTNTLVPDTKTSPQTSETDDSQTPISKIFEVLPAKDYLELSELDPIPKDILQWDKRSGSLLNISAEEPPYVLLFGALRQGYGLQLDKTRVPTKRGKFEVKFIPPLQSTTVTIRITADSGQTKTYRLLNHWIKIPPSLRVKVKEGDKIVEKTLGFYGELKRSAFVQLYSGGTPVSIVDIDSNKYAKLYFRIQYSKDDSYDEWVLRIKDSDGDVVGELRRLGSPPPFVDWREAAKEVFARDTYTYALDLIKGENVYEGISQTFETIEGLSLMHHDYLPRFKIEPKGEIGYFMFENQDGIKYSNLLLGGDLPISFRDRLLIRFTGMTSIHSLDPQSLYTFTRVGVGVRAYGDTRFWLLGDPFIFRADLIASYTGITTYPQAFIKRHSHPAILFEPHLVFWAYHYITPWVEAGIKPDGTQRRLSYGLSYYFFIRPWQLKLGLGFAFDKLTKLDLNPNLRFKVFRMFTSFTFFL